MPRHERLRPDTGARLSTINDPIAPIQATPENERGIWSSAFNSENDLVALMRYIERPEFTRDENFNLYETVKNDALFALYPGEFLGAQSYEEYHYIKTRVQDNVRDREALAAGGLESFAATMAAGIASPSILFPVGTLAAGLKLGLTVAKASGAFAATTAAAVGYQEATLQSIPNARPLSESLTNTAFATLLGAALGAGSAVIGSGVVGRAASRARPRPTTGTAGPTGTTPPPSPAAGPTPSAPTVPAARRLTTGARAVPDPAKVREGEAFVYDEPTSTVGAARTPTEDPIDPNEVFSPFDKGDVTLVPSGFATAFSNMGPLLSSPTLRGYLSQFPAIREATRGLDGGGLLFRNEEGAPVASSDVQSRIKTYNAHRLQYGLKLDEIHAEQRLSNVVEGEKLSKTELNESGASVIDHIRAGNDIETFEGPEVAIEVAKAFTEAMERVRTEVQRVEFPNASQWPTSPGYRPNMLHAARAQEDRFGLEEIYTEAFAENLNKMVTRLVEQQQVKSGRLEQSAEDLAVADSEELAEIRLELGKIEVAARAGLTPVAKAKLLRVEELKSEIRLVEGEQRVELERQLKLLTDSAAGAIENQQIIRNTRRRRADLNKSVAAIEGQIAKKEAAIIKTEELISKRSNEFIAKMSNLAKRLNNNEVTLTARDLTELEGELSALNRELDEFASANPDYANLAREADGRVDTAFVGRTVANLAGPESASRTHVSVNRLKKSVATARGRVTTLEKRLNNANLSLGQRANIGREVQRAKATEKKAVRDLKLLERQVAVLQRNLEPVDAVNFRSNARAKALMLDAAELKIKVIGTAGAAGG